MKLSRVLLVSTIFFVSSVSAKVLIITHSYNRPDFIEIQSKTFNALLHDDYEYVVFNDSRDAQMTRAINETCLRLGIRCFRVPQSIHDPAKNGSAGHRHMDCIQYSFDQIGYDFPGIVVLIDSDVFLLKPFSVEKYLEGYDIAGELEGRKNEHIEVRYLAPGLCFMNMLTMPNHKTISFEGNRVEGLACDVGGHTYYYMRDNPSLKVRYIHLLHTGLWKKELHCGLCDNMSCDECVCRLKENKFNDVQIRFIQLCPDDIEFYLDHTFLHYRCGSNWNLKPKEYHEAKTKALNYLIDGVTQK